MIRKPHNLVTAYWDDCEYFLLQVLSIVPKRVENIDYIDPKDKRPIRYAILSSFLFLEAFINAEYFDHNGYEDPKMISIEEKKQLDKKLIFTKFDDKWSNWIEDFCHDDKLHLKGNNQFQAIGQLKDWRNRLTHYKLHELMVIANDIETIENAKKANQIAIGALQWYYSLTKKEVPKWINRDVFKI